MEQTVNRRLVDILNGENEDRALNTPAAGATMMSPPKRRAATA
jgi:hypothetical protein